MKKRFSLLGLMLLLFFLTACRGASSPPAAGAGTEGPAVPVPSVFAAGGIVLADGTVVEAGTLTEIDAGTRPLPYLPASFRKSSWASACIEAKRLCHGRRRALSDIRPASQTLRAFPAAALLLPAIWTAATTGRQSAPKTLPGQRPRGKITRRLIFRPGMRRFIPPAGILRPDGTFPALRSYASSMKTARRSRIPCGRSIVWTTARPWMDWGQTGTGPPRRPIPQTILHGLSIILTATLGNVQRTLKICMFW